MRQKQLFLVFLLVVGGLAGRWWYSQKGERPVTYITTVVGRGPITRLVVATGNITNAALLALFRDNLNVVVASLEEADFVEFGFRALVVHRREVDDE